MPKLPNSLLPFLAALFAMRAMSALAQGAAPADTDDLEALLNQPVYAASKFAQDAANAPAAVTVLTAGDVRAYGWRTLAEVLNGVRGVYLRYDRLYHYVGVRGFSRPGDFSSRLLVLIDGMRINDNIYDQAVAGREFPLDVNLIERVEFIPGPGSSLYGSNAVLGVVNIVTKSAAALRGGNLLVEFGSSASRSFSITQGLELGRASLVLAAHVERRPGRDRYFAEYDSPGNNGGVARDTDREDDAKLYAKWSLGELTATALASNRRKQDPTGAYGALFSAPLNENTDRYGFADLQWQHAVDAKQAVYARISLAQYNYVGDLRIAAPDDRSFSSVRGRWLSVEARWLYAGFTGQRLMLGVEAQNNFEQRQRSGETGSAPVILAELNEHSHREAVFLNDAITPRPDVTLELGARLDRQLSGSTRLTPRSALVWEATPGLFFKALQGRAFREPNASESQYGDSASLPNPSLRSESLRATELALDWRPMPNLRLGASAYHYVVSGLIDQVVDPGSGLLIFNNVGAAHAKGFELEADYVGTSGWRARGSWSRQSTRDDATGEPVTNSPVALAKLNLSVPWPQWHARVGLECHYVGERLTVARAPLPSHTVANVTLQVTPAGSKWTLGASVYNLFDRAYADPAGTEHLQDTLAQDGRSLRVQAGLRF